MKRPFRCRPAAALALVLLAAQSAGADVFVLLNGDRVTGKRLRSGKRTFVVQTEFGRLTIPRAQVERVVADDGTEEVINAPGTSPAASASSGPMAMPMARLVLIVVGKSFWLAWDPKHNPSVDPSLRLEVRLDDTVVASYADTRPDPQDLPGATVNTFSFLEGDVEMEGSAGARLGPPEVRPGRASLRIEVPFPSGSPAAHRLRVTYQFNTGSAEEPAWKDLVWTETTVALSRAAPAFILMRQDPGKMDFSGFGRRRMRNIETFHIQMTPGS